MPVVPKKLLRSAIYTRKSTEHGLELEFNSLDAQREACEAYIKSQAHEGWKALAKRYDDPAYSGGNLERPALQALLKDMDAGRVDVVVVYKIDRLTRSLSDFAILVELFDKSAVSFVAVTQQFNTTTSMGRLTLNVLLSFAQFERELSSERVRDKVAASRKKGKWTGGGVPLGYDTKDKKLVVNEPEAEIVRYIYRRYLELKCLRRLILDLDAKQIKTKKRFSSSIRHAGGIQFSYGPLAYLLKNRTYLGEMGHSGKWYPGEHDAILDPVLFNAVQDLLRSNSITRRQKRTDNQSLLTGLLFDDRGNRMTHGFTTKRGVRYRFYTSSAILAGRRDEAGSVSRVAAAELEASIILAARERFAHLGDLTDRTLVATQVDRIILKKTKALLTFKSDDVTEQEIELARPELPTKPLARVENDQNQADKEPDIRLVRAIARAHLWLKALSDGTYQSVEELAEFARWNPKVVRKALRLAFLAPDITEAIIFGSHPKSLGVSELQAISTLSWDEQRRLLKFPIGG